MKENKFKMWRIKRGALELIEQIKRFKNLNIYIDFSCEGLFVWYTLNEKRKYVKVF